MDFRENLEFHDDSGRVIDKSKESILLMKKKMFRSHDLILQYNNIMKECNRLKGDLCIAQEKVLKFQKETNSNNSKIFKLESQIANQKRSCENLEQKIAEQNIQIAGDKCHTEQLICKVKELENKHSGTLIEADLTKSSLEEKIKILEQELKKLKKPQLVDLKTGLKSQRGRKLLAKNEAIGKETVDVGVNTVQEELPRVPVKSTTAEKSIMTDEFYHIMDNPYPIFCENCQSLTKPDIDKFCKMMTYHPPMLTEILSPPPPPQELTNFNDPLQPIEIKKTQESVAKPLSLASPEIESLKQKLATLERKIKKKNKQICRETEQSSGNCCGHSCQANCCSIRGSNRGAVVPPMYPDVRSDLFAEFWSRVMNSVKEKCPKKCTRERVGKKKSLNFNKRKMRVSMKKKTKNCVSSTNWDVESDDCDKEIKSNTEVGHLLRLNTSDSFIQELPITNEINKRAESVSRSVEKPKSCSKNRGLKVRVSFGDDDDDRDEPVEVNVDKGPIHSKNSPRRSSSRIREKSLRICEIKQKTTSPPMIESFSVCTDQSLVTDDSLCETKRRISSCLSENSSINQGEPLKCRAASVSRIDRSFSCSPIHGPNENYEISKYPNQFGKDVDVDVCHSDSDLNVSVNSLQRKIRKSRSKLFDGDISDGEKSVSQMPQEKNARKRKRSNSPTRSNRSVKSKLLCKLRALKKNTTTVVTKQSANIDDHTAACLSQTEKISNESVNDDGQDLSINKSTIEIAAKKQRIAHVPKRSLSKERDSKQEQETRIVLERLTPLSSEVRSHEKDENLDERLVTNFPCEESRGIHRSLDKMKGISLIIEKRKEASAKLKCPTTRNISKLEKSSEKINDNCSILEKTKQPVTKIDSALTKKIDEQVKPSIKTFSTNALIFQTPSDSCNNIFESSGFYENEEHSETCENNEEDVLKKRVTGMTDNDEMKIERAPEEVADPEPSSDEIKSSVVPDPEMEISSKSIDESPASPDGSQNPNPTMVHADAADLTKSSKNIEHASIYENVVLPKVSSSDEIPDVAGRNLITYDTVLLGDVEANVNEIDLQVSSDPQLFVDNSDTTSGKQKQNSENAQAVVKDLRTRKVLCSPLPVPFVAGQRNPPKIINPTIQDSNNLDKTGVISNHRGCRTLETLLTRHLGSLKNSCRGKSKMPRKKAAIKLQTDAEKSARSELDNLIESEEWSNSIHTSVVTKLCQVQSQRTVAKCIVDVLVERANFDETLDRTYTPPAPVMTRTQQRIAALIDGLERDSSMSGVFELVRAGISFNLFRLGSSPTLAVVEYLARMLTVMARLKKDRESVRILCCDALYFLGRQAPNVIYIALSIWPEILPMHDNNAQPDILTNCLIHLLSREQGSKVASIRRLLRDYYKYPENDQQSTQLIKVLMNQLSQEYTRELEATILLIAKCEGTEFAYKHIVHGGLLKLIEDDNCPWILNIITLFGFVLRTFPTEDEDKRVATMVQKLCDMLTSTQDLPDKEEGIIAALLSLARHSLYFKQIADTILEWKPTQTMRTGTIEQLESFFRLRPSEWWNKWKNYKSK